MNKNFYEFKILSTKVTFSFWTKVFDNIFSFWGKL